MKFIMYLRAHARDAKFDWDAEVELDDEVRAALRPHVVESLRAGRLRRPFQRVPATGGRRTARSRASTQAARLVVHKTGALVFSYGDDAVFLIEAPREP